VDGMRGGGCVRVRANARGVWVCGWEWCVGEWVVRVRETVRETTRNTAS
jgi:hypothetical protein